MNKVVILFLLILSFSILGCEQKRKFLAVGDNAPTFSLLDLDGNTILLGDLYFWPQKYSASALVRGAPLKGKEVILSFWASWCPECRQQMPILNGFAKEYRDIIEIIGVNTGEAKKTIMSFVKDKGIEYKILLDAKGQVAKIYDVVGVPANVLINKEGLIKNLNLDVRGMESYLRKE